MEALQVVLMPMLTEWACTLHRRRLDAHALCTLHSTDNHTNTHCTFDWKSNNKRRGEIPHATEDAQKHFHVLLSVARVPLSLSTAAPLQVSPCRQPASCLALLVPLPAHHTTHCQTYPPLSKIPPIVRALDTDPLGMEYTCDIDVTCNMSTPSMCYDHHCQSRGWCKALMDQTSRRCGKASCRHL